MGRLIRSEFQKILGRNVFYAILVSLLAFNLFFLWAAQRPGRDHPPLQAYQTLQKELAVLPNAERPVFVKQYYRDVQSLQLVEKVRRAEARQNEQGDRLAEQLKNQNPVDYTHALSLWENQEDLLYTENIEQEVVFAKQVYAEVTMLAGYSDFLSQIQQRSDILAGMSIFSPEVGGGFSSRSIQKTAADYAALSGTAITYDLSYGVSAATSALPTDCLVFVFLFLFAFLMIYDEKNKGLFPLIKSSPRGQIPTIAAKTAVLAVCSAGIVLLLYGSNLLFYHWTVGLGDLSRSLQSVGKFMGSTLRLSVGEFLLSFLVMKVQACFLIGLLVMYISIRMRKSTTAFLLGSGVLAVSFALYTWIPLNSQFTLLKYLNLFGLFRVQDLLGLYLNFNFFGWPISLFSAGLCATILMTFVLAGLNGCGFARSVNPCSSKWDFTGSFRLGRRKNNIHKSVMRHELFKILWMNKAGVLLAAYAVLILYNTTHAAVYLSPDETLYRGYMMQLSGPVTTEKADFIQSESQRFEAVQNQLNRLEEQAAAGEISEAQAAEERQSLTRELSKKPAFDRVADNAERVRENRGWLVYDTGCLSILKKDYSGEMLMICLMLIACSGGIFPMEYVGGMDKLLETTPLGRRYLRRIKRSVAAGMTLFILICGVLPVLFIAAEGYGLPPLDAPLNSLPGYTQFPACLSIGLFLASLAALKLLACMAVTSVILTISQSIRHMIYTLLVCTLIIALPILLTKLGLSWCGYLSLVPLFNAGILIAEQNITEVAAYGMLALALIAVNKQRINKAFHSRNILSRYKNNK